MQVEEVGLGKHLSHLLLSLITILINIKSQMTEPRGCRD